MGELVHLVVKGFEENTCKKTKRQENEKTKG